LGCDMPGVINQRYRIEHRYLSVTVGTVYRAYDLHLYSSVMIWILPRSTAYRQKLLLKEAKGVARLKHENILELQGHGVDAKTGQLFLVFKLLHYRTLSSILAESSPQPLPKELALKVTVETLSAVQAAHQEGIAHRRINPSMIFLWQNQVKLAGFGLAYLQESGALPAEGVLYLAPEQLDGEMGDARADLYSIGVVMFQVFTGELPFHGVTIENLRQSIAENRLRSPCVLNPQVPQAVGAVILRLLQEDPGHRYQTVAQVLDALNT